MKNLLKSTLALCIAMSLTTGKVIASPGDQNIFLDCDLHGVGYVGQAPAHTGDSYQEACFAVLGTAPPVESTKHRDMHINAADLTLPECFSGKKRKLVGNVTG